MKTAINKKESLRIHPSTGGGGLKQTPKRRRMHKGKRGILQMTKNERKNLLTLHKISWQSIFSVVVIIAFFMVLPLYLKSTTEFDRVKYGAIGCFLASTVYLGFKYWFPVKNTNR